jgi:hypothetical protein
MLEIKLACCVDVSFKGYQVNMLTGLTIPVREWCQCSTTEQYNFEDLFEFIFS